MTGARNAGTRSWRCFLAPLGVSTLVIADDPALMAAICAAYADWTLEAPALGSTIELRLERRADASRTVSDGIRVEGSRLTFGAPGVSAWADARSGQAHCAIGEANFDAEALVAEVVDTLLLFLLARSGRTPVHAAGVMLGDRALVLAGPSGTGKSTLALAAAERGLAILSDDTLYVELGDAIRLWGFPRPIHVFAEDAPPGDHAERLRGGKRKKAVATGIARARTADRFVLVVLERGEEPGLTAIAPDVAIHALSRLDPGFDLLAEASARAIRALAGQEAWRLVLSRDPRAAIDLLIDRFA